MENTSHRFKCQAGTGAQPWQVDTDWKQTSLQENKDDTRNSGG